MVARWSKLLSVFSQYQYLKMALSQHHRSSHCANRKDGSLCYFSIKENKRLVLLDGVKLAGAKAEQHAVVLTTAENWWMMTVLASCLWRSLKMSFRTSCLLLLGGPIRWKTWPAVPASSHSSWIASTAPLSFSMWAGRAVGDVMVYEGGASCL